MQSIGLSLHCVHQIAEISQKKLHNINFFFSILFDLLCLTEKFDLANFTGVDKSKIVGM